ncbi:WbqC family protein [Nocardiopsis mangrovi]|uniref:WbqC family protein n=1 Tax=Nocardiopsis mangrovi TaxID=1179818 RepID=A0ABV9E219_9ACTN
MRVAIHQPHYLPWLGLIDKIDRSDLVVVLDHVQYERQGWQNRNYLASKNGPVLLTIPLIRGRSRDRISDKEIDNSSDWREKHLRTLTEHCYGKAPFWPEFQEGIQRFYATEWDRLVDVSLASTRLVLDGFGIATPIVRAGELGEFPGRKSELLAQICAKVGATSLLCGGGARHYIDRQVFRRYGVGLEWQDFRHPHYAQTGRGSGDFLPRMAALDLLLNAGPGGVRLLREARDTGPAGPSADSAAPSAGAGGSAASSG